MIHRSSLGTLHTPSFPRGELLSQTLNFFAIRNMPDQSESTHFQALLESALHAYEQKTGIKLAQQPLAVQIQSCQSDDDINTLLKHQAQALGDIQASDRIIKSIKKTLLTLIPLSASATLAVGLVSQKPLMPDFASNYLWPVITSCESNTVWSSHPS